MTTSAIVVRPLDTLDEVRTFFQVCIMAFWPDANQEKTVDWWLRSTLDTPGFSPQMVRGAFLGESMVGGCVVHDRILRMPPACLRTDCIALVATHPDYRGQGVARAVLEDTIARARGSRHDLLLLGGIPNLYNLFGFVDIFDGVEHLIDRAYLLSLPSTDYTVRTTSPQDAPVLLELYRRYHADYSGSFERTLDEQQHRLRYRSPDNPPLLVLDPAGSPVGYMLCNSGTKPSRADEVAVESWPAALALLQYQAHLLEGPLSPPDEITWVVPFGSPTLFQLLDNLTFPRVSPLPPYPNWFVMRSLQRHLPFAGMMARPADLDVLMEHLLPRWQWHRQHFITRWPGTLSLDIAGTTYQLADQQGELQLLRAAEGAAYRVRLSQQAFTQLLFGFRTVSWLARQPSNHVPQEVVPTLEALFPIGHSWFAASDAF
jgi:predicted N-acetyltransferase YhbS